MATRVRNCSILKPLILPSILQHHCSEARKKRTLSLEKGCQYTHMISTRYIDVNNLTRLYVNQSSVNNSMAITHCTMDLAQERLARSPRQGPGHLPNEQRRFSNEIIRETKKIRIQNLTIILL